MLDILPCASWIIACGVAGAPALSVALSEPPTGGRAIQATPAATGKLPPQLVLGDRVLAAIEKIEIVPTLVLVRDSESYLAAISGWTPTLRYPVLLDDGTPQAAEDIGRFARAFKPEKVVMWSVPGAPVREVSPAELKVGAQGVQIAALKQAAAKAWGLAPESTDAEMIVAWSAKRLTPPGVVVVQQGDTAWTAGVAIAAFRGLPIIEVAIEPGIDRIASTQEADDFCGKIEAGCEALGLSWKELGDNVDAVVLASNAPAKFVKQGNESLAMTDRVGRLGTGVEVPQRWAWCGQIFGTAREAAYRAMCGLFMTHGSAWLFDGYPDSKPWDMYDCTNAGEGLKEVGLRVEVLDTPEQSAAAWRSRASKPVEADLVFVNTKGNADFYDLEPGQCKPGDVPILSRPVAMHIVHSWSAFVPGSRDLLAGRWLERGVYFYVGSVNEPYLQAFLPTPMVSSRMCSGAAWGAAVRLDGGPCWKIAVFGDPLIVFKRGWKRAENIVPLEGCVDIALPLRDAVKEKRMEDALRLLVLQGRDGDAVKIAAAVLHDQPTLFSPMVAELAVLPCFREKRPEDLFDAYQQLDKERAGRGDLRDALWLASSPRLSKPTDRVLGLLRVNIRKEQVARDALNLAAAWPSVHQSPSPKELLEQIRGEVTDQGQRDALDAAMKLPVSQWRK